MRRTAILAISAALLAGPAAAQPKTLPRAEDHLEPQASILGGGFIDGKNDMALREAMGEIFEDDVARMVGRPAFTPEYAVGLRKMGNNAGFRIVSLTLTKPLHYSEPVTTSNDGQLQAPPLPWKRTLSRCEMPIGNGLGERITEVWRKMLMRTRYSAQYTGGADGATFEFSMDVRGLGPISGKVWLPERNSSTGTLVALADELYDVCTKKKGASIDQVEKLTAELEHRLK